MCGNATFTTVESIITIPDPRTVVNSTQRPAAVPILSPLGSATQSSRGTGFIAVVDGPHHLQFMRVGCLSPSLPVRPCHGSAAGAAPSDIAATVEPMEEQLRRTVVRFVVGRSRWHWGEQHSRTSNCQNHLFGGTQPCTLRCSLRRHHQGTVRPARRNTVSATFRAAVSLVALIGFYALAFALIAGTIVGAWLLGGHLA